MEVIRQAPNRISRLALLDTNPKAESSQPKTLREPQIERVLSGNLHSVMHDEMKSHYLADVPGKQRILDVCMEMARFRR